MPEIENGLPERLIAPIAEWIAELREAQSLIFAETGFFGSLPVIHSADAASLHTPEDDCNLAEMVAFPTSSCWLSVVSYLNPRKGQWWRAVVFWSAGSAIRCQPFDENGNPTMAAFTLDADNDTKEVAVV